MLGIKSYGVYIPFYRLSRDIIGKAWGNRSIGGERSIANWDEDSLTMGVEATLNCLEGIDPEEINGLFFSSTTSPYKEKECSTLAAAAADLGVELFTGDFGSSLRAGTAALRAALDSVKSGSARNVLVASADTRLGTPSTVDEQTFGDGAAALLIGDTEVIASIEAVYSISDEITDVWRRDKDTFVRSWEDRWVMTHGYSENMKKAIRGAMEKHGFKPEDFAKVALYSPDGRSHLGVARSLGFDTKTQLQDPMISTIGNAGAAHALMMLIAGLEEAKPGDRILMASYGNGCDVFIFRVTEEAARIEKRQGTKAHLSSKAVLPTYEKYLAYRRLLPMPEEFIRLFPAATVMWRTRNWALRGHGSKCKRCGLVTFPIQRVCYGCRAKDEFEEVKLLNKRGKVFTFSLDNLAGGPDAPVVQTVVESDESGARIYCLMTDCDPQEVVVGMPVEMTFRKFHEYGDFHNYYWKCRPLR